MSSSARDLDSTGLTFTSTSLHSSGRMDLPSPDQWTAGHHDQSPDPPPDGGDEAEDPDDFIRLNETAVQLLEKLRENDPALDALDISHIQFTMKFYRGLVQELKHNTRLRELYLNGCGLTDDHIMTLVVALRPTESNKRAGLPPSTIEVLSLESNEIGNIGTWNICQTLMAADKYGRRHGGRVGLAHGPPSGGLRVLSLRGNALVGYQGAKCLAGVLLEAGSRLTNLNVSGNDIDGYGAGWLALAIRNNNVLKILDLRGNERVGLDGAHELVLACETAGANLVLASGAEYVARVCGPRNVTVLVDGDYGERYFAPEEEGGKPEEFWKAVDAVFKSPRSCAQFPVAQMKRSVSLGGFEPASTMAESFRQEWEKKVRFRPTGSTIAGKYTRHGRKNEVFRKVLPKEVEGTGEDEKEVCVSMARSRLRFKPGKAYSSSGFTPRRTPREQAGGKKPPTPRGRGGPASSSFPGVHPPQERTPTPRQRTGTRPGR